MGTKDRSGYTHRATTTTKGKWWIYPRPTGIHSGAMIREVKCLHRLKKKKKKRTDFPGGPWLRLQAPNAGATGARVRPPVGETKIPRAKKGDPMAQKREKKRKEKGKHISWKQ